MTTTATLMAVATKAEQSISSTPMWWLIISVALLLAAWKLYEVLADPQQKTVGAVGALAIAAVGVPGIIFMTASIFVGLGGGM